MLVSLHRSDPHTDAFQYMKEVCTRQSGCTPSNVPYPAYIVDIDSIQTKQPPPFEHAARAYATGPGTTANTLLRYQDTCQSSDQAQQHKRSLISLYPKGANPNKHCPLTTENQPSEICFAPPNRPPYHNRFRPSQSQHQSSFLPAQNFATQHLSPLSQFQFNTYSYLSTITTTAIRSAYTTEPFTFQASRVNLSSTRLTSSTKLDTSPRSTFEYQTIELDKTPLRSQIPRKNPAFEDKSQLVKPSSLDPASLEAYESEMAGIQATHKQRMGELNVNDDGYRERATKLKQILATEKSSIRKKYGLRARVRRSSKMPPSKASGHRWSPSFEGRD